MSIKSMHEFFSNYCVSNTQYTYIYPDYQQAENKRYEILNDNPEQKTSVGVFPVCKFMTPAQQQKVCRQKADNFYRFFH